MKLHRTLAAAATAAAVALGMGLVPAAPTQSEAQASNPQRVVSECVMEMQIIAIGAEAGINARLAQGLAELDADAANPNANEPFQYIANRWQARINQFARAEIGDIYKEYYSCRMQLHSYNARYLIGQAHAAFVSSFLKVYRAAENATIELDARVDAIIGTPPPVDE